MPEALSFTEIDRQHLELLPARAVMSMLVTGYGKASTGATGGDAASGTTTTTTTSSPTSSPTDALKDPVTLVLGLIPLKK
ncbi:MAG TPA: hypothetical protein VF003_05410 [Pseudonocardiaceae bacterium]